MGGPWQGANEVNINCVEGWGQINVTRSVGLWLFQSLIVTSLQQVFPPSRDSLSPYLGVLDWMPVYPQIHKLDRNLQCDGIRRWGFWEVMMSWVQGTHEWDQCPHQRGPQEGSRHPSCEELVKRQPSMNRTQSASTLTLNSQPRALWEIHFCY